MRLHFTLAAMIALLFSIPAWAQTDTSADTPPEADAPPEAGAPPSVSELFSNVEDLAQELQSQLDTLDQQIAESENSLEAADQALSDTLATVAALNGRLAEDSEIWTDLSALLDEWEERRRQNIERAASDARYQATADAWGERIEHAIAARGQISEQRIRAQSLVAQIEAEREIVAEWIALGNADAVLQSLNLVRDQITAMNESMTAVVESVGLAGGQETVATE
ncbi:MAG: hypothetical protein H6842_11125 [Rhodospirillaceae bacterium]|nr:hypothetical protein [Rhodospirillaceae bacterium]